jgi:antirestriction protein ArdC
MRKTSKPRASGPDGAPRGNVYEEVTTRIIADLEGGRIPWVQPWGSTGGAGAAMPRNALTARTYSGINVLLLWGAVIEGGYPSQSWLTFRQAQEAGGCVRKGEHGVCVVYADKFTPGTERERAREAGEEARVVPFLKRFTVFNVAQCEGLRDGLAQRHRKVPRS